MRFAGTQLSNFIGDTTDFTNIAGTAINGRSQERRAVMSGEADKAIASLNSKATILSAEHQADAIRAGGAAQGQASLWQGIGGAMSAIGGGIGSMGSSSGGGYYGTGSTGGVGNTVRIGDTGKYGTFQDPRVSFNNLGYTIDPTTGLVNTG